MISDLPQQTSEATEEGFGPFHKRNLQIAMRLSESAREESPNAMIQSMATCSVERKEPDIASSNSSPSESGAVRQCRAMGSMVQQALKHRGTRIACPQV